MPALHDAIDATFDARIGDVSGRGKLGVDMREIWAMQPRFDKRMGSSVFTLIEQPRFRAGFDFLRLRASTGEVDEELAHWWETFSTADDEQRRDMVQALQRERPRSARAATRATRQETERPADATADDPRFRPIEEGGEPLEADAGDAPARKRRRRRRKSGGGQGGASDDAPAP